jgi:hypothetical protein
MFFLSHPGLMIAPFHSTDPALCQSLIEGQRHTGTKRKAEKPFCPNAGLWPQPKSGLLFEA